MNCGLPILVASPAKNQSHLAHSGGIGYILLTSSGHPTGMCPGRCPDKESMRRLNAATVLGPVLACLFLLMLTGSEAAGQKTGSSTPPFDVESAFAEATRLHQAGDLDGAIKGYQAILARYPNRS